jgi:putative ABC transport system substrate-binding protein
MSRRLEWLGIAAAMLVAVAVAVVALRPPPKRHIAFLGLDATMQKAAIEAFRDELGKRGFVEGQNLAVDYRSAEGQFDRLPALARELVALNPEVLVTMAPPAVRGAQQATTTIPTVISVHDPVSLGFVRSLGQAGGNVTGMAFQDSELSTRRLDLLRKVVPGLTRVAILWNRDGGGPQTPAVLASAAGQLGIETKAFEVRTPDEIVPTVAAARQWGAQAVLQAASPFFTKHRRLLIDTLTSERLPASCEQRSYVVDGCLMTYSADILKLFRGMATITAQILNGAKVSELPFQQPSTFDLVVNTKTAQQLGLTIPNTVLLEATETVK